VKQELPPFPEHTSDVHVAQSITDFDYYYGIFFKPFFNFRCYVFPIIVCLFVLIPLGIVFLTCHSSIYGFRLHLYILKLLYNVAVVDTDFQKKESFATLLVVKGVKDDINILQMRGSMSLNNLVMV
jgi:hypothetical protein